MCALEQAEHLWILLLVDVTQQPQHSARLVDVQRAAAKRVFETLQCQQGHSGSVTEMVNIKACLPWR